jgi:hypothetical protein
MPSGCLVRLFYWTGWLLSDWPDGQPGYLDGWLLARLAGFPSAWLVLLACWPVCLIRLAGFPA